MESDAKLKLVKNNIIAKLGLTYVQDDKLEAYARRIIRRNETVTLEIADMFYQETGLESPCMDGMRY